MSHKKLRLQSMRSALETDRGCSGVLLDFGTAGARRPTCQKVLAHFVIGWHCARTAARVCQEFSRIVVLFGRHHARHEAVFMIVRNALELRLACFPPTAALGDVPRVNSAEQLCIVILSYLAFFWQACFRCLAFPAHAGLRWTVALAGVG